MEFESAEEALKVLKQASQIEIESQKVKIVRQPPDFGMSKCLTYMWLLNPCISTAKTCEQLGIFGLGVIRQICFFVA